MIFRLHAASAESFTEKGTSKMDSIKDRVHELYWGHDVNCARTMLTCLGELFHVTYAPQVFQAAAGMHGAGGFGAQCGLVEGALLFIGIDCAGKGKPDGEAAALCRRFARAFTERFGSLRCCELRPGGFSESDPPHLCEKLTCDAIAFAYAFLKNADGELR